jgi:membrane protease YdiL (CAAX protease family)
MAFFILIVSLFSFVYPHKKEQRDADKKSISGQTFKDMGITEQKVKLFFESGKPRAIFFKYGFFIGFFMLMAGVVMNFIFLFNRKKVLPDKIRKKKSVSWDISDILRVSIIVMFSGYALGAVRLNMDINLRIMLNTFLIDVIAGTAILYFILVKYREKISSLGITFKDFYKNVLSGITAYVFILPILISVLILSILFLDRIGYKAPPQPVFDMFFEEKRSNVILFLTIFVSVLGPVIEEIFFRGFLYSAVKKRFGIFTGVLLSAALFSMLHANILGFLPIMILGVLMAFLYEATGSLVASISVHILHNSIIVCFVFFIKELLK